MHYKILIQVLNLETIFPSRGRKKRRKENLNFFFAYKCERWKVHFWTMPRNFYSSCSEIFALQKDYLFIYLSFFLNS